MTLQWMFVAVVLYTELFLISLLMLPFISPTRWQRLFRSRLASFITSYSYIYFNIFFAILGLLFLESVRETYKYTAAEQSADLRKFPEAEAVNHMKLFRAQRNMYIAGFALFLWFVLRRLVLLISKEATLMAECEASLRQARSATDAAQQMMEERGTRQDNLNNTALEGKEGEVDGPAKPDTSLLEKQLLQSKSQLEETKEELYRTRVEFEAMTKQAHSTNAEYDRLLEEYSKLEKKLSVLGGNTEDKKSN